MIIRYSHMKTGVPTFTGEIPLTMPLSDLKTNARVCKKLCL